MDDSQTSFAYSLIAFFDLLYPFTISSLSSSVNTIKDKNENIIGRVYEFFFKKFALAKGKGKGEFYTPKCVVNLIAELIQPYKGKIYNPACGSGGMFVQSMKFVDSANSREIQISDVVCDFVARLYNFLSHHEEHEIYTFIKNLNKENEAYKTLKAFDDLMTLLDNISHMMFKKTNPLFIEGRFTLFIILMEKYEDK